MATPQINTYHCPCTTLLLATTHDLHSLPRRASPALDQAIILPLTNLSTPVETDLTTIHSLSRDASPIITRREDGYEKRLAYRCARCRVVVGYALHNEGQEGDGKKDMLYVLPGWLQTSGAMAAANKVGESEVVVGQGECAAVFS